MHLKSYWSIVFLLFISLGHAQDCTLGVGGKDTKVIIKVFKLNDEQKKQLETWIGELEIKNKLIEDEIKELFDKQPQSTQEEIMKLSKKYSDLKLKLVDISRAYDQKLIGIFDEKQYQKYIDLCKEAVRKPLQPLVEKPE